jgi:hypothetical protein
MLKADQDDEPAWQRYRAQPISCPICRKKFVPRPNAKVCPDPECKKAAEEIWWQKYWPKYYEKNRKQIIAKTSAARRRRHQPIIKRCIAPAPPGCDRLFCDKEFTAEGRDLTCSPDCSVARRWALQRIRYHADPQAKRDYKNAHYAANYAQPVGTTRCPNPACGREYLKRRRNQDTCGRPVCHLWKYGITHREEINARKRKKRRANPAYAAYERAYQRKYRKANPEKFKRYHEKRRALTLA